MWQGLVGHQSSDMLVHCPLGSLIFVRPCPNIYLLKMRKGAKET